VRESLFFSPSFMLYLQQDKNALSYISNIKIFCLLSLWNFTQQEDRATVYLFNIHSSLSDWLYIKVDQPLPGKI